MLSTRLAILFGVGIVVMGTVLFFVLYSNKGSHLELKGRILKVRTGALSADDSIAVLDFRVENPSDVPFVVRQVEVTLDKKDGQTEDGATVARSDLKQLFSYNRFLGDPYNDVLTIKDTVPPHATVDRMVAARFSVKNADLESAKAVRLNIESVDGPHFETSQSVK